MLLYLLQTSYFKEDDPIAGTILLVGAGAVLVIVLVTNILRNGLKMGPMRSRSGASSQKHFSSFALHRAAKPFGLNRDQTKVLEYVFKNNAVTDPAHVLNTPVVLDKHFKRSFKQIEKSANTEDEAEQKFALLFSVRNTIDIVQNTSAQAPGANALSANQQVVLTINQESYSVKIVTTKGDTVFVECPKNSIGSTVRFPRGTRGSLAFFTKNNKGFSIDCQVLGISDTSFGPAMELSRAGRQAKAMTQRRFRRRETDLPCVFNLVRVEPVKGKKPPRMIVEPRQYTGTIVDISIGGAAIKANASVPAGSRLKIEFENVRTGYPMAVLGQVLRINRGGVTSTILHIKFLKVPRKAMNAVNMIVFDYADA